MSSQAKEAPKQAIFSPYHRSKSDRMLESTKDAPNPTYLDRTEVLTIDNHSFIVDKDGKRRATRWHRQLSITCNSIFLDDQQKWDKENGILNRKIELEDTIHIKGEVLILVDTERDHLLFEFLTKHNDNVSNPNRVKPQDGEDVSAFKQLDYQKDATQEISKIEQREDAFNILNKSRKRTGATRVFDNDELGRLSTIFGLHDASSEEQYKALYDIADTNPEYFISMVEKQRFMIVADYEAAKEAGVVTFDGKTKKYSIDGEVVFTTSETDYKKQDADFIAFLSKESGYPVYTDMRNKTQLAQLQPK